MGLPKDALAERADYVSAAPPPVFRASEGDLLRLFDFHFKAIDATSRHGGLHSSGHPVWEGTTPGAGDEAGD